MHKQTIVQEFDPARVRPLPDQPRKRFRGIRELADSITEIGQSQPGIVTPVLGDKEFDAQLVDGERRLRACKLAGVPFRAEVRPDADAVEIFAASFGSNFGKQDHDAVEVAQGCGRLRDAGKTIDQIARIAGKSASWVSMHLSLLRLHPDVLDMMVAGDDGTCRLTLQLACLLVPLDQDVQLRVAQIIAKKDLALAAARRFILKEREAAGDRSTYQTAGHAKSLAGIGRALSSCVDRIGVYLDMPRPKLTKILSSMAAADKRETIKQLEDASESLIDLASEIEAHLPKRKTA